MSACFLKLECWLRLWSHYHIYEYCPISLPTSHCIKSQLQYFYPSFFLPLASLLLCPTHTQTCIRACTHTHTHTHAPPFLPPSPLWLCLVVSKAAFSQRGHSSLYKNTAEEKHLHTHSHCQSFLWFADTYTHTFPYTCTHATLLSLMHSRIHSPALWLPHIHSHSTVSLVHSFRLLRGCTGCTMCVRFAAVCVCMLGMVLWSSCSSTAPEESFQKPDWTTHSWLTSKQIYCIDLPSTYSCNMIFSS